MLRKDSEEPLRGGHIGAYPDREPGVLSFLSSTLFVEILLYQRNCWRGLDLESNYMKLDILGINTWLTRTVLASGGQ